MSIPREDERSRARLKSHRYREIDDRVHPQLTRHIRHIFGLSLA